MTVPVELTIAHTAPGPAGPVAPAAPVGPVGPAGPRPTRRAGSTRRTGRAARPAVAFQRSDRLLGDLLFSHCTVLQLGGADAIPRDERVDGGVTRPAERHEERDQRNDGGRRRPETNDAVHAILLLLTVPLTTDG